MAFQTKINRTLPLGVAGDFASTNPYASMLAGEGKLVAGDGGLTVGIFGFADLDTGKATNVFAAGARCGFVHRNNNALITGIHEAASMVIPEGRMVTLFTTGDFFTVFDAAVTAGQLVAAQEADGKPVAYDASATLPADSVATSYKVAETAEAGKLTKITTLG